MIIDWIPEPTKKRATPENHTSKKFKTQKTMKQFILITIAFFTSNYTFAQCDCKEAYVESIIGKYCKAEQINRFGESEFYLMGMRADYKGELTLTLNLVVLSETFQHYGSSSLIVSLKNGRQVYLEYAGSSVEHINNKRNVNIRYDIDANDADYLWRSNFSSITYEGLKRNTILGKWNEDVIKNHVICLLKK